MTTETRARLHPFGPDPKAIGSGPMKMTPPVEPPSWFAEPTNMRPKPTNRINRPAVKSLRNGYTKLSTTVNTIRIIANKIATLVHFISDPKMIGTGPIMITPPPFTSAPSFRPWESIATTITPKPTSTSRMPARARSTIEWKCENLDKGFCGRPHHRVQLAEYRWCEKCMMRTEHEIVVETRNYNPRGRGMYRCKKCGRVKSMRHLRPSSEIGY